MLRTQSADEQAVMDWFMRHQTDAEDVRMPYLDQQATLISFYMNYRAQPLPQGLEWMSGELLADSFMLIESGLPNVIQGVLGGKSVSVNAYTLAGNGVNKALDKGLYRMRRQADFDYHTMNALRMTSITGHSFQKNIWVTLWGEKLVPVFSNPEVGPDGEPLSPKLIDHQTRDFKIFNGPRTYYPDNERVWKSAATDMLGHPLVWIEEVELDLDYMERINADYKAEMGVDFYKNLDLLRHQHRTGLAGGDKGAYGNAGFPITGRKRSATEQAGWQNRGTLAGRNTIAMLQCYADVPKHVRDYRDQSQKRLVVFTPDGILLRDVPMPTYNRQAPFHDIKFMQVANEPYGRSPLWWGLGEIEQRSEMRNLRLAEAWMNIFRPMVANRNANFDNNDFINKPGAVWFFDHDTYSPTDVIREIQRSPLFQDIYREDALMEDHINRVVGSTPNMQGEGLGSRATAQEAQLVDMRSGGRHDLISRQVAWQTEVPMGKDYLGMFAAFSEDPLLVQVDGEEPNFPVEIWAEDIDFDYDVEINAGEYGIMNGQALMALREVFGLVMQNPEAVFDIDTRAAISAFQHRTGMDNILKPQAEADAQRQQAMMAQMMQQQAAEAPPAVA